tara:strand:+ start:570 stop:839 length:270 start_codon:yes stop_codon:yes gene_type:complete
MNWDDLYPELVNKTRWAIVSSSQNADLNTTYSEAQALATVFVQDMIEILKCYVESPGVLDSTKSVRGFFAQRRIRTITGLEGEYIEVDQ